MRSNLSLQKRKPIWQPVQYIDWLGIRWNSVDGCISIVEKHVEKGKKSIKKTIKKYQITARELAAVVGSNISMGVVFGRVARIIPRHCQISIAAADAWDTRQNVDDYCRVELQFWDSNLEKFNKKHCFTYPVYNKIIYSGASSYACGALIQNAEQSICHKIFTPEEISYSSTHRELIIILCSLRAFGNKLHNSSIKWYTDNQATAKIVDVRSMRSVLQMVAYEIFTYCLENHIDLHIEWIPRALNRQADFISKIRDCDDWQTTRELFDELNSIWGPHTVDCFSSSCNNKVDKFYSRFWIPECAGVDALYQSWVGKNCWLVPPVNIIPSLLHYMSTQATQETLIVPAWPSAVFWLLLWQRYARAIHEVRYYTGKECKTHGRNTKSVMGAPTWDGYIIATRLIFK